MKPIDLFQDFISQVEESFSTLFTQHAFKQIQNEWKSSTYCLSYKNQFIVIQINLGFKDQALYIKLFKVFENGAVAEYADKGVDWFPLTEFAKYNDKSKDWPEEIFETGFNLTTEKLAIMVLKSAQELEIYGQDILSGDKWYNWQKEIIEIR